MFIVTDKEDVIIHISETKDYQENGNLLVDNGKLAIAAYLVNDVYEVDTIDEGVVPSKYCYTTDKGFYKNPNYKEYFSTEDRIAALEEAVNSLLGL